MNRRAWLGIAATLASALGCVQVPKTTAQDPTLPAIRVGDYAFHAETFGAPGKPPLIVIHGGPGGDYAYLRSLEQLADEYHVLMYDQRNSGRSPRTEQPDYSIASFVDDLDALVDLHSRGRKVRLVGHSWGAMIATAYLARHGDKVSHAVLAEPGILTPEAASAMVRELRTYQTLWSRVRVLPTIARYPFVATDDGHERLDHVATRIMESAEGPPYQCEGERLPHGSFVRAGYRVMKETVIPLLEDPGLFRDDYTAGLASYGGKALFLSGRCSFIGYGHQERFHRPRFPVGTGHIVIEGTGHNMFTLKPAESLAAIRPFLRD